MNRTAQLCEKVRAQLQQPLTQVFVWALLFLTLSLLVTVRWQPLEKLDIALLRFVNKEMATDWLDILMSFFSRLGNQPVTWLLIIGWLGYRFWQENGERREKVTRWVFAILTISVAFGLADGLSGRVVKPLIGRERPEKVVKGLRLVGGSGRAKSFPSSHAANAFAVARTLHELSPPRSLWWLLAFMIALSRVYLGAHFPSDVVGGALLGLSLGAFVVSLKRRWQK